MASAREMLEALTWFDRCGKSLSNDIDSAHSGRGNGASDWMREDDRDFRRDLKTAFKKVRLLTLYLMIYSPQ